MARYKNFLALTKARKTTYEFDRKNISKSNILKILEAARWAPSCGNVQPWHFIVVENRETIRRLTDTTHYVHAPFIHPLPPTIIAFVFPSEKEFNLIGEPKTFPHCCKKKICKQHENELELCLSIAAFSATLAATDLGISSCILTPEQDLASKILKIKDKSAVRLLVGLGYEKKNAFQKKRTRKPLQELVSYEYY